MNVHRREENAISLAVKFLKAGCGNIHLDIMRGSQWGGGFYGYRLKFLLFYGYRLIFFSYG